jgi:hypothetical protein
MILSGPPSRRRGLMSPWLPCFGAALLLSCAGTTYGTGDASDTLDRGAPDEDALARDVPEIAEDRRPDTGIDLPQPRDIQDVHDAGDSDMDAGDIRDVAEEDAALSWDVPDAFSWDVDVPPPDRGDVQLPDGGCETLAPGPLTHRSCNPDGGAPAGQLALRGRPRGRAAPWWAVGHFVERGVLSAVSMLWDGA